VLKIGSRLNIRLLYNDEWDTVVFESVF